VFQNHILFQIFRARECYFWIGQSLEGFEVTSIHLNLNYIQTAPPDTVLAGSACRHPAAALPHLPLSLPHPAADTRSRCHPAPPVSCAASRRQRRTALPCLPACLLRECTLLPLTVPPRAILAPRRHPSFSLSPSTAWHARAGPHGLHFPLCSSCALADLEKTPVPHSALFRNRA
jgi:hypothetical protein